MDTRQWIRAKRETSFADAVGGFRIVKSCREQERMVKGGQAWSNVVERSQTWANVVKDCRGDKNCQEWSRIVKYRQT